MSMHLHHPSLSLNGKKKGKIKFRNAEEARKSRELDAEWEKLKQKWDVEKDKKQQRRAMSAPTLEYRLSPPPGRTTSNNIKSVNTGEVGVSTHRATPVYTGTKVKGIGTMHKSNAVPIFSDDEAKEISSMRR